ncbi:MAG: GNAT family N-acetyltransferase [Cyanophyceae cyanobacterium]
MEQFEEGKRRSGEVLIRIYEPPDRPAVLALHEELQAYERPLRVSRSAKPDVSNAYIREFEEQLADPDCDASLFVAEKDDTIVGFAFCVAEEDILDDPPEQIYLQDLTVTKTARSAGVGRSLVEAVRRFARQRGISRINLMVLATNKDALAAYRAMGFEIAILHLETHLSS